MSTTEAAFLLVNQLGLSQQRDVTTEGGLNHFFVITRYQQQAVAKSPVAQYKPNGT